MTKDLRKRPIGVFDSGMGGLTVMRALTKRLPHEDFVYLGDTARLPYGTKSPDTVRRYAVQCAKALKKHRIKLLVVACNTASAVALPALREALAPMPVIGVIEPGADAAVEAAPSGRIAVIATEGTVKGGAYRRAIQTRNARATVTQQACPLFVALAEEGLTSGAIAELTAKRYLDPLKEAKPEALVLGCTHFPALKTVIANVVGKRVKLVDSADTTAQAVVQLLKRENLAAQKTARGRARFMVTDSPERFARVGEIFLGAKIPSAQVKLIDLGRLQAVG